MQIVLNQDFINKFPSLNLSNKQEYEKAIKVDFNIVFEERFADKPSMKISPERIKTAAMWFGIIAITAASVAALALLIIGAVYAAPILGLFLGGVFFLSIDILPIVAISAGAFGILSGLFFGIGKLTERSKEYHVEKANEGVETFLKRDEPFENFYTTHKELFDKNILKFDDINILLKKKISNMSDNQILFMQRDHNKYQLLSPENKTLLNTRIENISQAWKNLKVA